MTERIENLQQAFGKIVECTDGVKRKLTATHILRDGQRLFLFILPSIVSVDNFTYSSELEAEANELFIGGTVVDTWKGGAE